MNGKRLSRTRRSPLLIGAVGAVSCLLLSSAAMAATLTVGPPGGGGGEQYTSIQTAVNASSNGDVVLVSAGLYQETVSLVGKNITLISTDPDDPTACTIEPPGPSSVQVILLGVGNVAPVGFNPGTTIDGFQIRNGAQFGINCDNSNAPIQRCVITTNGPASGTSDGAGIFKSKGEINLCTISNNVSRGNALGGAGALLGAGATLINCTVHANQSITAAGGGVAAQDAAVSIINCTFTENTAPSGGAIAHFAGLVSQCTIVDNSATGGNATDGGGAIAFGTLGATGAITRNTIRDCVAQNFGGGIFKITGGVISRNRILECTAFSNGGGIADYQDGEIQNNLIYANNSANHGGGVYLSNGNLFNNTMFLNHASGRGGACRSVTGLIRNDIFWDNSADVDEPKLSNCSQQKFCCYNGAATGSPNFNRAGDPLFQDVTSADPGVWNFTPTSNSCQNTGKDLASVVVDFFGNARPFFGGSDDFDIGAIEF